MRAAVFLGSGQPLALQELPTPQPGPEQILVKVAACGVCHLLRGVLGGLGATIFGTPVEADEVRCRAAGDSVCHIVVRKK